ncbi:hypothetical protein EMIT0P260_70216 [Pseudomonas sp. IT-P260]
MSTSATSSAVRARNAWPELAMIPCGSEPAREGTVSVDIIVNDTPLSRAGSLPQLFCSVRGIVGNKKAPVSGASLFSDATYMFG